MKKSWLTFRCLIFFGLITMFLMTSCQPTTQTNPTGPSKTESQPIASKEKVLLPFSGPQTGPSGLDGQSAAKAAKLAADLANTKGGICGGRLIESKAYDTKSDPKEGANIASILSNDKSVLAVVADFNSSVLLAEAPIYNDAHILQFSYFTSVEDITIKGGPYTYRVYPPGSTQSAFLVETVSKMGYKKVAQIYENEDFGQMLSQDTIAGVKANGGEVIISEPILADQTDVSAVLSKIKAANPDVIIGYVQYSAASYIMKQARSLNMDIPFMCSDGCFSPELSKLGGSAVEGVYTITSYDLKSTDPVVSSFVKAFQDANGGEDPNNPGGYVFDAASIIIEGLNATNCTSREALKEWFDNNVVGKTRKGVTGDIYIDENRDRGFSSNLYTLLKVTDGNFVVVK